jgi:hypothetical protein
VSFVELVEHDAADALQLWVGEQPARQHALGQKAQTRLRPRHVFKSDLIADCLAHALAALLRDAARGHARGYAARLKHEHVAAARQPRVEERGRQTRRLPRAGRRLHDEAPRAAERLDRAGQNLVNRQRLHASSS